MVRSWKKALSRFRRGASPSSPVSDSPTSDADRIWRSHFDIVEERMRSLDAAVAKTTGGVSVPSYYVPSAEGAGLFPGSSNGNGNGAGPSRNGSGRPNNGRASAAAPRDG